MDSRCCGSRVAAHHQAVWVAAFQPNATGESGLYAGFDTAPTEDVSKAITSAAAVVFWGGLHLDVQKVGGSLALQAPTFAQSST